jgi:NADPH-dependent glutamate synthase beta subunit-like oxidoreductase
MDAGVGVKTQHRLGRDFTIGSLLQEGASAVFVATGGWDTQMAEKAAGGVAQPIPGVALLVDYVLAARQGKAEAGDRVVIVGGGKAAIEAARAAKEGGAEVCIVFRSSKDLVPAAAEDLDAAEAEGIRILYETALIRMIGQGSDLSQVEVTAVSGEDEAEIMDADTLLTGAGRFPELIYVPRAEDDEEAIGVDTWQTVVPYASPFARDDRGIFRDGEVTGDYKAVIEAIGAGRRAASSIQRYLADEPVEAPVNMIRTFTRVVSLESLEPVPVIPREKMAEIPEKEQLLDPDKEICLGLTKEQADKEAKRCLQCGIICYRRTKGSLH